MSAPVDVAGVLAKVAGASNDTFRLAGSPLQGEAREAGRAFDELMRAVTGVLFDASLAAPDDHAIEVRRGNIDALRAAYARVKGAA